MTIYILYLIRNKDKYIGILTMLSKKYKTDEIAELLFNNIPLTDIYSLNRTHYQFFSNVMSSSKALFFTFNKFVDDVNKGGINYDNLEIYKTLLKNKLNLEHLKKVFDRSFNTSVFNSLDHFVVESFSHEDAFNF